MKVTKHIKIRVGEPLTAIASSEKGVAFGSISGYIGYYSRTTGDVHYIKEVFEELIRTIQFISPETAYACVGDECGLLLNFRDAERIIYEEYLFTGSFPINKY